MTQEAIKQERKRIKEELDLHRILKPLTPRQSPTVTVKNYPYLFGFTEEDWQALLPGETEE